MGKTLLHLAAKASFRVAREEISNNYIFSTSSKFEIVPFTGQQRLGHTQIGLLSSRLP